jgi:UDP-glucose 4-epimerase
MQNNKGFSAFNLGNGDGFSVLEVIRGCEKTADSKISFQIAGRRDGDPAMLVSENTKAKSSLCWKPRYGELNKILSSAWLWHHR